MSPPQASGRVAVRHHSRRQQLEARRRRLAVLAATTVVVALTVLVTAFGGGGGSAAPMTPPAMASRLLPAGPPEPEVISRLGDELSLNLPVNQSRVTAIGYSGGGIGALALVPVGSQANEGLLKRFVHKVIGGGSGSPRWYQLPGGTGPTTSALNVGAPSRTDVYAPVDGTIVGISKVVLNGRVYGRRIDIQPRETPSLVVSVSRLRPDPSLKVGQTVTASGSKLGQVLDLSKVEQQALARYTNDEGNHVLLEVRPAATPQSP
jgi:hypothetical protein